MHKCPNCRQTCDCDDDDLWLDAPENCACCVFYPEYEMDEEDEYYDDSDYYEGLFDIPYAACVHGWKGLLLKIKDCIDGHVHGPYSRILWSPWPGFFYGAQQSVTSHFSSPWLGGPMLGDMDDHPF